MCKFPVKVDLSAFFQDERKNSLLMVDPSWENVECFLQRLKEIFGIENVGLLTKEESCFIPSQESVELLRTHSNLRAFLRSKLARPGDSKDAAMESDAAPSEMSTPFRRLLVAFEAELRYKRKFDSIESANTSKTSKKEKRFKRAAAGDSLTSRRIPSDRKSEEITSTSAAAPRDAPPLTAAKDTSEFEEEAAPPKKKKRTVKKQKALETEEGAAAIAAVEDVPKEDFFSSTKISNECSSPLPKKNKKRRAKAKKDNSATQRESMAKHTRFESGGLSGHEAEQTKDQPEAKVHTKYICKLSDADPKKARSFVVQQTPPKAPENQLQSQQTIEIQEQIIMKPWTECTLNYSQVESAVDPLAVADQKTTEPPKTNAMPMETTSEVACHSISELFVEKSFQGNAGPNSEPSKANTNDSSWRKTPREGRSKRFSMMPRCVARQKMTNCLRNINEGSTEKTIVDCSGPEVTLNPSVLENGSESQYVGNESQMLNESQVEIDLDSAINTLDKAGSFLSGFDITDLSEATGQREETYENSFSEVIDLNETENDTDVDPTLGNYSPARILEMCVPLQDVPKVDDIIVFKMGSKTAGKITDYIVGRCEYINKRTKSLKLFVYNGQTELQNIEERFICRFDDGPNDSLDNILRINIKLTEMIEPKVLATSVEAVSQA